MADINDVLERLITDPAFRQQLHADRDKALEGYDLTDDDRELLAAQLSEGGAGGHQVEQRTSKSAFAGLLGDLADAASSVGDAQEAAPGDPPEPQTQPQETDHAFVERHAAGGQSEPDADAFGWSHEVQAPRDIASGLPSGADEDQPTVVGSMPNPDQSSDIDEQGRTKLQLPFDQQTGDGPDVPGESEQAGGDTGGADAGQESHDDWFQADSFSFGVESSPEPATDDVAADPDAASGEEHGDAQSAHVAISLGDGSTGHSGDDPFSFSGSSADAEGTTASAVPEEIAADAEPENTQVAMETVSLNFEEVKLSDEEVGAEEELAGSAPAPDDAPVGGSQSGEYVVTSATHEMNAESEPAGDNPAGRSADPDDSSDSD
jgi:hypothetical protein